VSYGPTETTEDYVLVKKTYPEAFVKEDKTFNLRCEEFTVFDPDSGRFVGPTAFSRNAAWHHAAERLRRGEQ
jgi:hypothetical protein